MDPDPDQQICGVGGTNQEREREREREKEREIPGLFHECILIILFALFTVLLVHIYINYSVEKK